MEKRVGFPSSPPPTPHPPSVAAAPKSPGNSAAAAAVCPACWLGRVGGKKRRRTMEEKENETLSPSCYLVPDFLSPPRFSLHPPFLKKREGKTAAAAEFCAMRFPPLFFLFFFAEGTETFNFFFYGRLTWSVDAVFSYTRGKRLSFACVCFYWGGME